MNILMIEDDEDIAAMLESFLESHHLDVHVVESATAAFNVLQIDHYDLIILDLTLPEMDGLELCRRLRTQIDTPIIISSARSDVNDKIVAFDYGADDYLPKPYEPRELIARINSVMRRYHKSDDVSNTDFELYQLRRDIVKKGMLLDLTQAEYEVLALFIQHGGRALSRDFLVNNSESISSESGMRTIDVIINRLRGKIEDDPKKPRYIKSIRGYGYRFDG